MIVLSCLTCLNFSHENYYHAWVFFVPTPQFVFSKMSEGTFPGDPPLYFQMSLALLMHDMKPSSTTLKWCLSSSLLVSSGQLLPHLFDRDCNLLKENPYLNLSTLIGPCIQFVLIWTFWKCLICELMVPYCCCYKLWEAPFNLDIFFCFTSG